MIVLMGFADFMRKSYESNRSLLGSRNSLKEVYTEGGLFYAKKKKARYKKSNPQSLKVLKQKLRIQNRNRTIRLIIAFTSIAASIGLLLYNFLNSPI